MTRNNFVHHAVVSMLRSCVVSDALKRAVEAANEIENKNISPWDDPNEGVLLKRIENEAHRRGYLLGEHDGRQYAAEPLQKPVVARRAFSVSVYLQHTHDHSVLLVKHKRLDLWLPIGGERQGDETPLETAKRKVRQETGWDPEGFQWTNQKTCLNGPVGLLGYEEHTAGDRGLHMNFVFTAVASQDLSEPISDGSWSEYVWAGSINVNPVPVPPNVGEILHLLRRLVTCQQRSSSSSRRT
jgi:8-oxo-dGTP diphosphatase